MKTDCTTRRALFEDENADARMGATFVISAALTIALVFVWIIAPPASIGVSEGQLAPEILGQGYLDGEWQDFQLTDHINFSWVEGAEGQWILLQFIDTDCPHCWKSGADMSEHWPIFGDSGAVLYVTIAVEVVGSEHSRDEIVAFKEKQDYVGCKSTSNCENRPGDVHPWMYVDALNSDVSDDYALPGVPFELLLSPDGIVIWNGAQHKSDGLDTVDSALRHHLMEDA